MFRAKAETSQETLPVFDMPSTEIPVVVSPVLSVVIPVYNEAATIIPLLEAVCATPIAKQIIVVDDGSRDATVSLIEDWRSQHVEHSIELLAHAANRGKGAAIRTGIEAVRGTVTIVQDADLEYDPNDYAALVEPILSGQADVVFGSRYMNRQNYLPWTPNRVCVHLLNLIVRLLYWQKTTDEATCYKLFRSTLLPKFDLKCQRFEFCPEVTAKICRMGIRIHEIPIRYNPRTKKEGKKIGWRDGVQAISSLVYWRFARFRPDRAASN